MQEICIKYYSKLDKINIYLLFLNKYHGVLDVTEIESLK